MDTLYASSLELLTKARRKRRERKGQHQVGCKLIECLIQGLMDLCIKRQRVSCFRCDLVGLNPAGFIEGTMLYSECLNRFDNILNQRNPAAKNRSNGKDAHRTYLRIRCR